jgi:hypothetical protein
MLARIEYGFMLNGTRYDVIAFVAIPLGDPLNG